MQYVNGIHRLDPSAVEYLKITERTNSDQGNLEYYLIHSTIQEKNADNWRLGLITVATNTQEFNIVDAGAMEMAIRLNGEG